MYESLLIIYTPLQPVCNFHNLTFSLKYSLKMVMRDFLTEEQVKF